MALPPRSLLQYNELLDLFPAHIRKEIHSKEIPRIYKPGETIFAVGEGGPYFMASVVTGRIRMSISSMEHKEMLITMVERGEIFGEMSVVDNLPRAVGAMAEAESLVHIIRQEDFMPLLFSYPEAMYSLLKATCYRMRFYIHTLELIALQHLPARLGRYLLRLARDYGEEKDGQVVIRAGLNQIGMAQQVAATRESINKQLKVFCGMGLIELRDDTITLLDVARLKQAIAPAIPEKIDAEVI